MQICTPNKKVGTKKPYNYDTTCDTHTYDKTSDTCMAKGMLEIIDFIDKLHKPYSI